jgi:uncharacterized protein YbjT (DUF2867 family)
MTIASSQSVKKVLVTGATGRTGSLVLAKLRQLPQEFEAFGFARFESKVQQVFNSIDGFFFGDIKNKSDIEVAIQGCKALVILTSAVPKLKGIPQAGEKPEFEFEPGEKPEQIDYWGQKYQIDAAIQAQVEHIILVGSTGSSRLDHPLNKMGDANILIWKRKAEEYLINSGIDYTIIRAGGLLDEPDGQRELIVGQNDTLSINPPQGIRPVIPRADVAELVVQALREEKARNKAFDAISWPASEPPIKVNTDFAALFSQISPGYDYSNSI